MRTPSRRSSVCSPSRDTLRATMRVTVRIPATSANLGPGFDSFGLAWDLCNELVVDTAAPPGVTWEGEGADELPADGSDLIGRVMSAVAGRMSLPLAPLARRGRNRIPLERGLGSSSAATVAGVVAASALLDLGIDADPISVFALAAERRLAPMPEAAEVVAARWRDHVPVCVSGAGPSLVVFERADRPPITLETLGLPAPWRILRPGIRSRGFEVEIGGVL